MAQQTIASIFKNQIANNIDIFAGGKTDVDYTPLTDDEKNTIARVFTNRVAQIARVAPSIAEGLLPQKDAFVEFGAIAKAIFPESRPIKYPTESGTIGVDFIFPYALKWSGSAESTLYDGSTFDVELAAGSNNLFGASYKTCATTDKHSMMVLAKDGLLEIGNSPRIDQIQVSTDIQNKYAPIPSQPLSTIPVDGSVPIYQHATYGMIPMYHNLGMDIKVHAKTAGTSTLVPIGMVYYEHDFYNTIH